MNDKILCGRFCVLMSRSIFLQHWNVPSCGMTCIFLDALCKGEHGLAGYAHLGQLPKVQSRQAG